MTKKKLECPKCKSNNVAVIFYGYPADMKGYLEGIEDGLFVPGGCCLNPDDSIWHCNACHCEFGQRFKTLEELEGSS